MSEGARRNLVQATSKRGLSQKISPHLRRTIPFRFVRNDNVLVSDKISKRCVNTSTGRTIRFNIIKKAGSNTSSTWLILQYFR